MYKVFSEEVIDNSELVFTESAILDLLSQIPELNNYDIGASQTIDGTLILQIGDNKYNVISHNDEFVSVDDKVVDEIQEINEETYNELIEDPNNIVEEYDEDIESGILKEAIKTLAIGGLVRLGKKYLDSDKA